jgi:hypothetical protein
MEPSIEPSLRGPTQPPIQPQVHAIPTAADMALPLASDRRALGIFLGALGLGLLTQALFWEARLGLDWFVWDLAMVTLTLATVARRPLRATSIVASAVCLLFGAAFVLHRSVFTSVVALPANIVMLGALPVIVGHDLELHELTSIPKRLLQSLDAFPNAVARTVTLPRDAIAVLDGEGRSVARRTAMGLLLGLPAAGIFTLLLCADPGFAAVVARVQTRLGAAFSFVVWSVATAALYAFFHVFSHVFHTPRTASAPPGPSAAPAVDAPYRVTSPSAGVPRLSPLTWGIIVGQVAAVFAVYVVVHRDTEFGGHAVVRERLDVTYASHLHAGFYQLLIATMLSVCLVVVGHRLLRPLNANQDMAVPGGIPLAITEGTLLVLTGLTLVSCAQRLRMYEEAYGATHLRLGVAFVGLVVGAVLLATLAKSLFRGFRAFGGATVATVTACLLVASFFDADGYIARSNLDRAERGKYLDEAYLASLSADACTASEHAALQKDPELRARLVAAWASQDTQGDLRGRRGLGRCPQVHSAITDAPAHAPSDR